MRNPRGGELGRHAARAESRLGIRAGRHRVMFGGQLVEPGNMRCLRVRARVRRVEAVNIRQEHQHIRAHHLGDARGQPVIVAIADLVGRDGVILVDDRNRPDFQQGLQRRAGVQPAAAVFRVAEGEQGLADGDIMRLESPADGRHQAQLADGRGGLFLVETV